MTDRRFICELGHRIVAAEAPSSCPARGVVGCHNDYIYYGPACGAAVEYELVLVPRAEVRRSNT